MKFTRRSFAVLLALLMLVPLVACGGTHNDTEASSASSEESSEPIICIDPNWTVLDRIQQVRDGSDPSLPKGLDLNGETVDIDCPFDENGYGCTADWIMADDFTSDRISNFLYDRKLSIEDSFSVKLNFFSPDGGGSADVDSFVGTRLSMIRSGLGDIDIYAAQYHAPSILLEGVFEDLVQLDHLNFDLAWWFGDMIDQFTLDGHSIVAFGAITPVSIFDTASVVLFNEDAADDISLYDLYKAVTNNMWTYEYAEKITVDHCSDIDGDKGYTAGDIYGAKWASPSSLFCALGGYYTSFDENGVPSCELQTASTKARFDKCRELLGYYEYTAEGESQDGVDGAWFEDGRVVLYGTELSLIHKSNDWDFKGGILPLPKLDEKQEDHVVSDSFTGAAIPINATNTDTSALVLEALAYYGWRDVIPAYYDNILHYKYSSHIINAEMLELMYQSFSHDPTWLYTAQRPSL